MDVFNKRLDVPKYARMVSVEEIEKNEFNLNLSRYIDSQQAEDLQNIEGHLKGGIPQADIDALQRYWGICPRLRQELFKANRPGYLDLSVEKSVIKSTIYEHPEFAAFISKMNAHFDVWQQKTAKTLRQLKTGCHPKKVIVDLSEDLLVHWPVGNVGPGRATEGSIRLASSWIDGSRQPLRWPVVRAAHWNRASAHRRTSLSGAFSQTSPVSLSNTASLFQFVRITNRVAGAIFRSHDGSA